MTSSLSLIINPNLFNEIASLKSSIDVLKAQGEIQSSERSASASLKQRFAQLFTSATPSAREMHIQEQVKTIYAQLNEAQAKLAELQKKTSLSQSQYEEKLSELERDKAVLEQALKDIQNLQNELSELIPSLKSKFPTIKSLNEAQKKLAERIQAAIKANESAIIKTRSDALKKVEKRLAILSRFPRSHQKEWISEEQINRELPTLQNLILRVTQDSKDDKKTDELQQKITVLLHRFQEDKNYAAAKALQTLTKLSECFHKEFRLSPHLCKALVSSALQSAENNQHIEGLLEKYLGVGEKEALPSLEDLEILSQLATQSAKDLSKEANLELAKLKDKRFEKAFLAAPKAVQKSFKKLSKTKAEASPEDKQALLQYLEQKEDLKKLYKRIKTPKQEPWYPEERITNTIKDMLPKVKNLPEGNSSHYHQTILQDKNAFFADLETLSKRFETDSIYKQLKIKTTLSKLKQLLERDYQLSEVVEAALAKAMMKLPEKNTEIENFLDGYQDQKKILPSHQNLNLLHSISKTGLEKDELAKKSIDKEFERLKSKRFDYELAKAPANIKKQYHELTKTLSSEQTKQLTADYKQELLQHLKLLDELGAKLQSHMQATANPSLHPWQSELEINHILERMRTPLTLEVKKTGSPFHQTIIAQREEFNVKLDTALKRFENDIAYRRAKISQNDALLRKFFQENRLVSDETLWALHFCQEDFSNNEKIEEILATYQKKPPTSLSFIDLHLLSSVLKKGKENILEQTLQQHEKGPASKKAELDILRISTLLDKRFEKPLKEIEQKKIDLLAQKLSEASPEEQKSIDSLIHLFGGEFPLSVDTKLALLDIFKKNASKTNTVGQVFPQLLESALSNQQKALEIIGGASSLRKLEDLSVSFADTLLGPIARGPEVYIQEMTTFLRSLGMKAGNLQNSQLVTDAMLLALYDVKKIKNNPGLLKGPIERHIEKLDSYQSQSIRAKLSPGELKLADAGYIETGYEGVWGKTSWKRLPEKDKLKLVWQGGYALPSEKEPHTEEREFTLDFSLLGKLTAREELNALRFVQGWSNLKEKNRLLILNAINQRNPLIVPKNSKLLIINEKMLEQLRDSRPVQASSEHGEFFDRAQDLVAIADQFDKNLENALVSSFIALGKTMQNKVAITERQLRADRQTLKECINARLLQAEKNIIYPTTIDFLESTLNHIDEILSRFPKQAEDQAACERWIAEANGIQGIIKKLTRERPVARTYWLNQ